jgi:hypothetical protein
MSSDSGRDFGDYVTDNSSEEEGTLFVPVPEGHRDPWMRLCAGILTGLAGAVLVPVSPWVGGALISIGYGLAAFNLKGSPNSCARALCFGFTVTALLGVALVAGEATAPVTVQHLVLVAGKHHAIFASFALMPWALAVLKFLQSLVARSKRGTCFQQTSRA